MFISLFYERKYIFTICLYFCKRISLFKICLMTSATNLLLLLIVGVVVVGRVQLQIYASRWSWITFKVDEINLSQSSDRLRAPGCRLGGWSHMESQATPSALNCSGEANRASDICLRDHERDFKPEVNYLGRFIFHPFIMHYVNVFYVTSDQKHALHFPCCRQQLTEAFFFSVQDWE